MVDVSEIALRRATQRGCSIASGEHERVFIVRALMGISAKLNPMDYCFTSRSPITLAGARTALMAYKAENNPRSPEERIIRKAIEHATTCAMYHDEPHIVIVKQVLAQHVFNATNPGEYFYDGPEAEAIALLHVDPDGDVRLAAQPKRGSSNQP